VCVCVCACVCMRVLGGEQFGATCYIALLVSDLHSFEVTFYCVSGLMEPVTKL
jgi:hypothetical protein